MYVIIIKVMKIKQFFIGIFKRIKSNVSWKSAILLGIFIALLAADLLTKYYEELGNWNFTVIPGFIEVEHGHRNPGAGFSWLADKEWGQAFLITLTFILSAVIIGFILGLSDKNHFVLKICLCFVLAGAIGNLCDRLAFGEVRDFVWILIVNAYCNFADFWIVLGGIALVIVLLFFDESAVFPLTARAKQAQAERAAKEKAGISGEAAPQDGAKEECAEESDLKGESEEGADGPSEGGNAER